MKKLRSFELGLWDCQSISGPTDVVETVELVARLGLIPGVGAWTREGATPQPVHDIVGHVAQAHRLTPAGERAANGGPLSLSEDAEFWRMSMVCAKQPQIFSNLVISRRGGDCWDLLLLVGTSSHADAGVSLRPFCDAWGPFLQSLGDALYVRTRPTLSTLTNTKDEVIGFPSAVARRKLIVGWRTWFSPAYVEAFGRDWLQGLPDSTAPLDDGGLAHGLNASPIALAENDPQLYVAVWPYLEQAGVEPAWPRARTAQKREPTPSQIDRELTEFRRELIDLLAFTIVLEGNVRVKVFGLELGPPSEPQRALALQSIREAVEQDLSAHPGAKVRLEVYELPSDLQAVLDGLVARYPRFSYTLLPTGNQHAGRPGTIGGPVSPTEGQ